VQGHHDGRQMLELRLHQPLQHLLGPCDSSGPWGVGAG